MRQLALIAVRNLIQNRRRSLMLGGAIAGVTAVLVLLTCLSSGIRKTMFESALTVSSGHINVGGFYKVTAGQAAPLVTDYRKVEALVRQTLPDVDFITARGRGWARLVSEQGSQQVGMVGVDYAQEPRLPKVLSIKQGSLEGLKTPGTVVLFAGQAKKLKVGVGDNLVFSVLTPRGVNNTVDVRVVAVAEDLGLLTSWSVFVPNEVIRRLYQLNENSTGAIHIYLQDQRRIPADIAALRKALEGAGYGLMDRDAKAFFMKIPMVAKEEWTGQKLDLTDWEDEITFISWILLTIQTITGLLTFVLLIIIAIGIMNTLWIAIRERTREIGTLRAIGMQRWRVGTMFTLEALLLSLLGTLLGTLLGCLAALGLDALAIQVPPGAQMILMSPSMHFAFEPAVILFDAGIIALCSTLVALFPSLKAARLRPVTAMSHVG